MANPCSVHFLDVYKRQGQRIQQLFNFCLHLCQLHLIGGQFRIDFFLSAVEYLKVFELFLHGDVYKRQGMQCCRTAARSRSRRRSC